MGGPSNKNAVLPLEGLFAPIPATPGLACVVCLDGEPEPRGVCCWESHSVGRLGIRSARMRANAGSARKLLNQLLLGRPHAARDTVIVSQGKGS